MNFEVGTNTDRRGSYSGFFNHEKRWKGFSNGRPLAQRIGWEQFLKEKP